MALRKEQAQLPRAGFSALRCSPCWVRTGCRMDLAEQEPASPLGEGLSVV